MVSGDPPNTARKPSGKKAKPLSQKEQSERFKEAARLLDADETGGAFERAIKKVLPGRRRESNQS
jgi:hypothetical protein